MRAFSLTFLSRQFGAWAVIALGAVTARVLGRESRGAIESLVVLRLALHAVACLGLPTAATYAVARRPEVASRVASTALGLGLRAGAGSALLLAAFALLAPHVFAPISTPAVLAFALSAPAIVTTQNLAGVLLGAGRSSAWNALTFVNRGVLVAGLGLLFLPGLAHVETVVVVLVVAEGAAAYVALRAVATLGPLSTRVDRELFAALRGYGVRAWGQGMLSFALMRVDVLLLAALAGTRESGLYAAAGLAREMVLFLPWIAGMLLLPKEAAATGPTGPSTGLLSWLPRGLSPRGWAITLGAALLLGGFAEPFVTAIHGAHFADGAPLVRILVVAAVLAGAGNLEIQELLGRGASGWAAAAPAAALVVAVVGNLVSIPGLGAEGTAWTALASGAVLFALTTAGVVRVRRRPAAPPPGPTGPPEPTTPARTSSPA